MSSWFLFIEFLELQAQVMVQMRWYPTCGNEQRPCRSMFEGGNSICWRCSQSFYSQDQSLIFLQQLFKVGRLFYNEIKNLRNHWGSRTTGFKFNLGTSSGALHLLWIRFQGQSLKKVTCIKDSGVFNHATLRWLERHIIELSWGRAFQKLPINSWVNLQNIINLIIGSISLHGCRGQTGSEKQKDSPLGIHQ